MLSFFNLGSRAAHFRCVGTVAVSNELLIKFIIGSSRSAKHSSKILEGIGSRTHDLRAIFSVTTVRSLAVMGVKDLSSPCFIGSDVSLMSALTTSLECINKSFLRASILFSKKSAKLFAN